MYWKSLTCTCTGKFQHICTAKIQCKRYGIPASKLEIFWASVLEFFSTRAGLFQDMYWKINAENIHENWKKIAHAKWFCRVLVFQDDWETFDRSFGWTETHVYLTGFEPTLFYLPTNWNLRPNRWAIARHVGRPAWVTTYASYLEHKRISLGKTSYINFIGYNYNYYSKSQSGNF